MKAIMGFAVLASLLPSIVFAQSALLLTTSPNLPAIVRHPLVPPSIILSGVTIPPSPQTLYLSGQVHSPIDATVTQGFDAYGDTRTQAINVFQKIEATLVRLGWSMQDVVKLQVFLVGDPKLAGEMDFAGSNAAYRQYFGTTTNPNLVARSTMQIAGLANPFWLVEIEATAARVGNSDEPLERAAGAAHRS